jgi:hypothetical protein
MNSPANPTEMKRYRSAEWNFALDIPRCWHAFPPVSSNSPFEAVRFASKEDGNHLVIVFRAPCDPKKPLKEACERAQQLLAGKGFGNFSTTETTIGPRAALLLEFDRPQDGGTWSCREYFVAEGTLQYTLGFGTNKRDMMFELYDRMARSFEFSAE